VKLATLHFVKIFPYQILSKSIKYCSMQNGCTLTQTFCLLSAYTGCSVT